MATNESKTAAGSVTNAAVSAVTKWNQVKPSQGYDYDSYLAYDENPDPFSGNEVRYNSIGQASVITNEAKS